MLLKTKEELLAEFGVSPAIENTGDPELSDEDKAKKALVAQFLSTEPSVNEKPLPEVVEPAPEQTDLGLFRRSYDRLRSGTSDAIERVATSAEYGQPVPENHRLLPERIMAAGARDIAPAVGDVINDAVINPVLESVPGIGESINTLVDAGKEAFPLTLDLMVKQKTSGKKVRQKHMRGLKMQ